MRSSAISSAKRNSQPPATPARDSFALTGPSRPLDPRTHAVRRDIADVRLAAQVFAPHYAAPSLRILTCDTTLREGRAKDSAIMAQLSSGDRFELFEITADDGWGIATGPGLVGYVDAAALTGRTPD